jgi:hypothetical protein
MTYIVTDCRETADAIEHYKIQACDAPAVLRQAADRIEHLEKTTRQTSGQVLGVLDENSVVRGLLQKVLPVLERCATGYMDAPEAAGNLLPAVRRLVCPDQDGATQPSERGWHPGERAAIIQDAVYEALGCTEIDYSSSQGIDKAAKQITDFVEAALDRVTASAAPTKKPSGSPPGIRGTT